MKILQQSSAMLLFLLTFTSISTAAYGAPEVTLSVSVEKEVQVTDANGQVTRTRMAVEEAAPGDTLFYTLRYQNSGDEPATNVKLDNPIPEGMSYVGASAWGTGTDILFSIDQGQTFKQPASLTYRSSGGETRAAAPEQYTNIRWLIPSIAPGSSGEAGFTALVK